MDLTVLLSFPGLSKCCFEQTVIRPHGACLSSLSHATPHAASTRPTAAFFHVARHGHMGLGGKYSLSQQSVHVELFKLQIS